MSIVDFNFTEEVTTAFSEGDCWFLAQKLHDANGWKMYWAGNKRGPKYYSWCHIFIIHEDKAIDVNGVQDLEDFKKTWKKIAKKWGAIKNSSDFTISEVEDISIMTKTMRPKYTVSCNIGEYVSTITRLVNEK